MNKRFTKLPDIKINDRNKSKIFEDPDKDVLDV